MKKLSQKEIDINDTIQLFYFIKKLNSKKQLLLWLSTFKEDLKIKSINFGQPLILFLLLENNLITLKPTELIQLSLNFLKRCYEFNDLLIKSKNKMYIDYNNEEKHLLNNLNLIKINPFNLNYLQKSFFIYLEYCLIFHKQIFNIGVYKRWQLN